MDELAFGFIDLLIEVLNLWVQWIFYNVSLMWLTHVYTLLPVVYVCIKVAESKTVDTFIVLINWTWIERDIYNAVDFFLFSLYINTYQHSPAELHSKDRCYCEVSMCWESILNFPQADIKMW